MYVSQPGLDLLSRRGFLAHTGSGLGGIALAALLAGDRLLAAEQIEKKTPLRPVIDPARPYAPRAPHFAPRAKNVLVLILMLIVLLQLTLFFLVKYNVLRVSSDATVVTTQPARFNAVDLLHYGVGLSTFLGVALSLVLATVVYLLAQVMLVGRLIGVVCGASATSSGGSRLMRKRVSAKASSVSRVSVSVGSIMSASRTIGGK